MTAKITSQESKTTLTFSDGELGGEWHLGDFKKSMGISLNRINLKANVPRPTTQRFNRFTIDFYG